MARDDATAAQVTASLPEASTWLMANAGSGKTRVLTDRVARLLLRDVEPQRILCLTYTKSAASEMQNRLFKTLGEWAMKPDDALRRALGELGEERMDAAHLARARRLFARAIETPGGLRIQTIHSFCATLLRRFPLEAGVSPRFGELDDRSGTLLRQEILEEMANGLAAEAVTGIAREFSGNDFMALIEEIVGKRGVFGQNSDCSIDFAAAERELAQHLLLGVESWFGRLLTVLAEGSTNDVKAFDKLTTVQLDRADSELLQRLEKVFLYGEDAKAPFGAKVGKFPTGPSQTKLGDILPKLNDLMSRVEAAREQRLALQVARKTAALTRFARAFLPIYEARKAEGGWLDFDDLIARATDLVTDPSVAAWVLYRLDGGIDHVLVDEAQDTSPAQWRVIELLTAEFTAGLGARDEARTLFVVGDQKQSIYSFQGANVAAFDDKHAGFKQRFTAAGQVFQSLKLEHSFRSSPAILRFVDAALHGRDDAALGAEVSHIAFRDALPGRVDLWPLIEPNESPEDSDFEDPVDLISAAHHHARLAERLAGEIRAMLDQGVMIPAREGPRPVHAGDFLILVQGRSSGLFTEIIRACKKCDLPIAGADRLKLAAELAVKDLLALLSFLDTPDDNLSLAAVLRSPLCGLSEADLFDVAHKRAGNLWESLQEVWPRFEPVTAFLADMRAQVDFLRPYDLLERVLIRHDGRRRLVARLGDETEEAIDELLNQALAYERADVPSLTGFLIWLDAESIEVKRQAEASGRRIRVMTVHGAKGLESEVVILPDTADHPHKERGQFYVAENGTPVWKTPKDESPPQVQALRALKERRDAEERLRLLYVAMTRARCWLMIGAAGKVKNPASWYGIAGEGMARVGGAQFDGGTRFQVGDWPAAQPRTATEARIEALAPDWALALPGPAQVQATILTPSNLGGAKAMPGEAEMVEGISATARGDAIHLLLQHLPGRPEVDWPRISAHLVGHEGLRSPALDEAGTVLRNPGFAHLFGPGSFSEVGLTADLGDARIYGVIDRLVVRDTEVLAVDFKSNAVVPDRPEDVPDGLLRQLGAYHHMLGRVYPGRRIGVAILWTRAPRLMPINAEIVSAALQRATRDGVSGP